MERKVRFAVAATLGAAALAGPAGARPGVIFGQPNVPTVKVISGNDNTYDRISGPTYPLDTRISANCPDSGVESLVVTATGISGAQDVDISDLRPGDRSVSLRTVLIPYSLTPIEWPQSWRQTVVAACNANLSQQMSQGRTRSQVFARDWSLGEVKLGQLGGHLGCAKTGISTSFDSSGADYVEKIDGRVKVICGKHMVNDFAAPKKPITGSDDLTYGVHVVSSHLTILPRTGGNGPCGVTLSGVIETDAINATVTFFYKNNKGGITPWRSVKTDHSKTAFFSDFIDFKKPGGLGEAVAPTPAPSGPAAGTFAAPQSGKDFHGTYQIVGKNMQFESNIGHFAFNCAAPPVTNFSATPATPVMPAAPTRPKQTPPSRLKKKP